MCYIIFFRRVYAQDSIGTILEDLATLQYLTYMYGFPFHFSTFDSYATTLTLIILILMDKHFMLLCSGIDRNYMSGTFPAFIGNLTQLIYL